MIYLDNASTSFPKPREVAEAMRDFLDDCAVNPGRGNYRLCAQAARIVEDARFAVASLFGISDPSRLAFTLNATDAINAAVKGFVRPGDRVVATTIEHNAALRPLATLAATSGVNVVYAPHSSDGTVPPAVVENALDGKTRLVIYTHASNVYGVEQDIAAVAEICRAKNVRLLVDASQTAGHIKISAEKIGLDMLAFSGHKGLYGPPGTGCLYVRKGVEIAPWREGGAGEGLARAASSELAWPQFIETGTQNTVGIAGLGAAARFVADNFTKIAARAEELTRDILAGLRGAKDIEILGATGIVRKLPVVSFVVRRDNWSPRAMALALDESFGIAVRGGEHCAPLAFGAMSGYPVAPAGSSFVSGGSSVVPQTSAGAEPGALRASPGFFTTATDVEQFVAAVKKLLL